MYNLFGDYMYTIKDNSNNLIEIKNSKFITCLYKVNNIKEIDLYLDKVKKEYKDATHYCYSYIIDDNKKSSDDGEPGGTAGIPILQVLEKRNMNYILCIVIRYFGGIKLGAGGLVRAYTKSVTNALDNTSIIKLIPGYNLDIIFSYDQVNDIDYLLKNTIINNKEFNENITYNINVDKILLDKLKLLNITINNIKEIYIEK